jgi:hypothetical protein
VRNVNDSVNGSDSSKQSDAELKAGKGISAGLFPSTTYNDGSQWTIVWTLTRMVTILNLPTRLGILHQVLGPDTSLHLATVSVLRRQLGTTSTSAQVFRKLRLPASMNERIKHQVVTNLKVSAKEKDDNAGEARVMGPPALPSKHQAYSKGVRVQTR